jgi:Putative F0F1-ATPase subunit Ca2+/Mg2+ transporter
MAGTLLQSKGLKSFGRYGSVGFELLASLAVGYYLGHWLDGKLGTHWLGLVGFLLGCYAGFSSLFRTAKQMQRDIEREEKLERGEDPWAKSATPEADVDENANESVQAIKDRIVGASPARDKGEP